MRDHSAGREDCRRWQVSRWAPSTVLVARLNSNGTLDSTFGASGFKVGAQAASGHDFQPVEWRYSPTAASSSPAQIA